MEEEKPDHSEFRVKRWRWQKGTVSQGMMPSGAEQVPDVLGLRCETAGREVESRHLTFNGWGFGFTCSGCGKYTEVATNAVSMIR